MADTVIHTTTGAPLFSPLPAKKKTPTLGFRVGDLEPTYRMGEGSKKSRSVCVRVRVRAPELKTGPGEQ